MSLDGEAVKEMRAAFAAPRFVQNETQYGVPDGEEGKLKAILFDKPVLLAPNDWKVVDPKPHEASKLIIETLTGVADYVRHNVDAHDKSQLMIHVRDFSAVEVIAKIDGEEQQFRRQTYLRAQIDPSKFPFGQYLQVEAFTIGLITCFEQTLDRDELQKFIVSIKENYVRDTDDDGVSQEVRTSVGVAFVKNATVKNPWRLQPWRTFREVEQPDSAFILRARPGGTDSPTPLIGLFEADGGEWKNEATQAIAAWLRKDESTKDLAIIA